METRLEDFHNSQIKGKKKKMGLTNYRRDTIQGVKDWATKRLINQMMSRVSPLKFDKFRTLFGAFTIFNSYHNVRVPIYIFLYRNNF